ncbi:MAG: cation transporter [Desulfobacteraceae bacterium]|jgi:copper chaperone CopZ|nr:cation transporter [Desulfobacteraceae bacterium]
MKMSPWISENKILIFVPLLALFVAAVFVLAYNTGNTNIADQAAAPSYPTPTIETADKPAAGNQASVSPAAESPVAAQIAPDTAKVVFQVDGMSCSGCIATIKSSLAGYDGIRDIIVNISGGTAEVYYDSGKIKDLDSLATSITDSGYPTRITQVMTADQLKEEEAVSATRAKVYIASVGGWDISRTDFDAELAYAANRYKKAYGENVFAGGSGKNVLDSIKAQVVSRLINEGIQMQEVQRVGYRVDPKIFDQEFDEFLSQKNIDPEGLKASLEENGYPFDYFMKKFENRVILRQYIENQVLNNAASDYDKQQQYLAWFGNARTLSKVTIYDKQLERLTQSQSAGGGCGSSCKS